MPSNSTPNAEVIMPDMLPAIPGSERREEARNP
jgi:hypothetical protein